VDAARRVAQASITLLENKNQVLPLRKNLRVAVVGPNADNAYNQLGDYTATQDLAQIQTLLAGVREKVGDDHVAYAKGCGIRDTEHADIASAVQAARRSDVVIVAVGGSSARDFKTSYKETGAAEVDENAEVGDIDCGEGFDRATLSLLGRQTELLEALKQTGKPLVVVYMEGRPLLKNWAHEHADALIDAYYPGQEGGRALADVIFGDYNPAGRLPVSVPVSEGQLPVYYNKKVPAPHKYVEMEATPLYAFGYGLSYTTFDYANLNIEKRGAHEFVVSCDVTNSGDRDGEEVVQLYLRDELASTVQPILQLASFRRVPVKKGETVRVELPVNESNLQIIDTHLKRVVEPGDFKVMVGASSADIRLEGTLTVE